MTCVTLALSENFKKVAHVLDIYFIYCIAYYCVLRIELLLKLLSLQGYYTMNVALALKAGVVKDDSCASTENFSLTSIFLVPVERAGARKGKLRRTKPKELGGIVLNVFSKAATLPLKYLLH